MITGFQVLSSNPLQLTVFSKMSLECTNLYTELTKKNQKTNKKNPTFYAKAFRLFSQKNTESNDISFISVTVVICNLFSFWKETTANVNQRAELDADIKVRNSDSCLRSYYEGFMGLNTDNRLNKQDHAQGQEVPAPAPCKCVQLLL